MKCSREGELLSMQKGKGKKNGGENMPRLKERPIPFRKMKLLLKGYGFNGENLVPVLGYSPKTNRGRIEDPRLLTLGDLENLCKKGHIPIDEIREAMVL